MTANPLPDAVQRFRDAGATLVLPSGRTLWYRVEGEGEPLLLLHSYPTASWGWHRLWPELAGRYRVLAVDLLGSGFSDKPAAGPYDIPALADQAEHAMTRAGFHRAHVLAHAYGSIIAQELLARRLDPEAPPDAVPLDSVCFVNGGLFPEATRPTAMQKLMLTPLGDWLVRLAPQPYPVFCRKFSATFGQATRPGPDDLAAFWAVLRLHAGHKRVPRVIRYLRDRVRHRARWVGALEQTTTPISLINAAADPVAGASVLRRWRELLPDRLCYELDPRIGHYPPFEDPDGVMACYDAFRRALAAHPAASAAASSEADPGSRSDAGPA